MKRLLLLTIILTITISSSFSEEKKSIIEKEGELLDFSTIKSILENDGLDVNAKKQKKKVDKAKKDRTNRIVRSFDIPKNKFWSFMSEYWIVKNAPILKWDFQKPDYGLDQSFREFLERMEQYELNFKILLVNTPNVTHFVLPSNKGELIFLLSVPFIRTLDLSKLEISLLLFEDLLRHKKSLFQSAVSPKGLDKLLGGNFYKGKFDKKTFDQVMDKYDQLVFNRGFNFQQQYEVTTQMGALLKSDLKLWNIYINVIEKIDNLVKSNLLYSKYNNIYPSPELQINWLRPRQKRR